MFTVRCWDTNTINNHVGRAEKKIVILSIVIFHKFFQRERIKKAIDCLSKLMETIDGKNEVHTFIQKIDVLWYQVSETGKSANG
jgi:hypothetical protein